MRYLSLFVVSCLVQWVHSKNVKFDLTLTWEDWFDGPGQPRKMIFANGQFPGPELRLNQGDNVEFHVTNGMKNATTVHFHERHTMVGRSPRTIAKAYPPGRTFFYKWTATQYGAYFYHAHTRGQIDDGLYGPIHIQASPTVERPFHLITNNTRERKFIERAEKHTKSVLLSDWRQLTSEETWDAEEATRLDAYCVNALLINGKGSIKCLSQQTLNQYTTAPQKGVLGGRNLTDTGCVPPVEAMEGNYTHNFSALVPTIFHGCHSHQGPTETLRVDPRDRYVSYDLISTAGTNTLMFSIDEHKAFVYAVDGRYIEPLQVDAISLANGYRFSVLVKLDSPPGDYTVRLSTVGLNQILNTTATLSYERNHTSPRQMKKGQSIPSIDIVGSNTTANTVFLDDSAIIPFPIEAPSQDVAQTHILRVGHHHTSYRWTLGNSSYPLALENSQPLLFYPNSSLGHSDMTIRTQNNTWVDLIFDVFEAIQPPHPIHKHSNKFYVIGQGEGAWNYTSVAEAMKYIPESFNLKTPQHRDTYITPAAATGPTWLAVRYHVDNPGAFLLHCHIQVHLSGGMALGILDGIDAWPEIPEEYQIAH